MHQRDKWDKRGIGQGTERTRRSIRQMESPERSRRYITADLGQRPKSPVNWGNNGTQNVSGNGWRASKQLAQVRAESGQLKKNNAISYHARTTFDIPHSISDIRPAPTEVQIMTRIVGKLYGTVHDNMYVRARRMDNDDVIDKFNGNRISVWGPGEKVKELNGWFAGTSSTHASGPQMECQMED